MVGGKLAPDTSYGTVNLLSTKSYLDKSGTTGLDGDTWHFTAWDNQGGGTFNGGHVYGTYNDGHMPGGTNGANAAFVELTTYDPADINNTNISLVNQMTSLGGFNTGGVGYCPMGWSWKSSDPFSLNNNIYLELRCLNTTTLALSSSTLIMSPDHGAHWCNVGHYLTGGNGGVDTCDAGNWSATGDVPTVVGDMLWPGVSNTDASNPMAEGVLVQTCQNQSVNCPSGLTSTECDPSVYMCWNSLSGDALRLYASRVSGDPMILANWQYWDGSNYQSTLASITPIAGMFGGFGTEPSIEYIPDAGVYLMAGNSEVTRGASPARILFSTAPHPYGPWTYVYGAPASIPTNFPTLLLFGLTRIGANHYSQTMVANGTFLNSSLYHPSFLEWDFFSLNYPVVQ